MAKKPIKAQIKLQVPAAQANPAPPVGPALVALDQHSRTYHVGVRNDGELACRLFSHK